ncbi:MAG: oligoendopeptidase [Spirochaetia bacterium]|nr:oligoendopeptidase [Spirochaetia bacterium]
MRWDLSPIYPDCESPEFLEDLSWMVKEAKTLEIDLDCGTRDLQDLLERYELILDYLENLSAYSSACFTTDTSNEKYLKAVSQTEEASLVVQHLQVVFLNYLATHKEQVHSRWEKDLAEYRYVLSQLLLQQQHQMDPLLEDLASDLQRSGADAFSRLQDALGSSIQHCFDASQPKTLVQLRSDASHADRQVRKQAFEREIALLKQYETPFAAALNSVKGASISLDTRRAYTSSLERSLEQSRIDRPILDALISALEESLPLFRTYLNHKAKLLNLDCCTFYDLFAPINNQEMHFSYAVAQEFIVSQFSSFSDEMGAFATKAFSELWIDAESRNGKVGGAYDTAFPLARQSRILTNFDETYSAVSTLAHELGHAYHDSLVLDKSHLLRSYPMTLAETASIFSEFLIFQGALKQGDASMRLNLIEHFLQESTQVCVDILSRYYFESELFARRKKGELSAKELCEMMECSQKKTYGDALCEYHPYMWAVKGHYYSCDLAFYNYPYAFGQLFGLGLYSYSKKDPVNFPVEYKRLLANTGCLGADEVAQMVGIDLRDPQFYKDALGVIASYVKEFVDGPHH